jgi:hypothetical protein
VLLGTCSHPTAGSPPPITPRSGRTGANTAIPASGCFEPRLGGASASGRVSRCRHVSRSARPATNSAARRVTSACARVYRSRPTRAHRWPEEFIQAVGVTVTGSPFT